MIESPKEGFEPLMAVHAKHEYSSICYLAMSQRPMHSDIDPETDRAFITA